MQLQGRNLSQGMTGDDVLLLKVELALLDFEIFMQPPLTHVPSHRPAVDEYTPTVAAAVRDEQERNHLPATGVVGKAAERKGT